MIPSVEKLKLDELLLLNKNCCSRIKQLQTAKEIEHAAKFHINQQVKFLSPKVGLVKGKILRINTKTCSVLSDDGVHWTVSPSLLKENV